MSDDLSDNGWGGANLTPPAGGLVPTNHKDLTHDVVQNLRSAIISGRLRPGEFIRIAMTAQALNVSATPVREALVALRGDGLVESKPNRGFRVVALSRKNIEDTYLVHRFVAGELAARAAVSLDTVAVDRLQALQEQIVVAHAEGRRDLVGNANEEFHEIIYAGGQSPKLSLFLGIALRYVPRSPYREIKGWAAAAVHDHDDILVALRERDPDCARSAMVAHIEHALSLLLLHLESGNQWEPYGTRT